MAATFHRQEGCTQQAERGVAPGPLARLPRALGCCPRGAMSALMRSSLTSRRFPALRNLTSDDVEVFALPPEEAKKRKPKGRAGGGSDAAPLFDPDLVKPTAVNSLGPNATGNAKPGIVYKPIKDRPPFRPCNPIEAREEITLRPHGYVGIHSPYDMAHHLQQLEVKESTTHAINPVFVPNAPAQARESVKVNYFLTSPDAETIEAERRYIQEKAAKNLLDYQRRMKANMALQRDKAAQSS